MCHNKTLFELKYMSLKKGVFQQDDSSFQIKGISIMYQTDDK